MNGLAIGIALAVITIAVIGWWLYSRLRSGRRVPDMLRHGRPLPDFRAIDEQGDPVRSTELHGAPAVILFVRGSWCPFCSSQVANLTRYYKDIVDLGARLILVTPTALVVDAAGIIRYSRLSWTPAIRPDPKELLAAIRSTQQGETGP